MASSYQFCDSSQDINKSLKTSITHFAPKHKMYLS